MENESPIEAIQEQIHALIAEHGKPNSFTGGVSQEVIDEISKDLSVTLPEGYIKLMNWSPFEPGIYLRSESFLDYFLEDLEEAVLNMYD